jgi:hypothetical protein
MKLKVVGRLLPLQRAVAADVPTSRTAAGLYARDTSSCVIIMRAPARRSAQK